MARHTDKINVIDQCTYQILKKNNGDSSPKILRSAKYKNKHKKEQQCTLLDYLVAPRQQQKGTSKHRRPNLIIARKSVAFLTKRKGKTRLHPKRRVARLKRIIRNYRTWKHRKNEDTLQQAFESMTLGVESTSKTADLQEPQTEELQTLTVETKKLIEFKGECGSEITAPLKELHSFPVHNVESNTIKITTESKHLSLHYAESTKATLPIHQIHSRRFRSYCDNCTTTRLKELTTQLLNDLDRFQKRAYAHNEIKARAHPRFVVGFRESLSRLRINKVKLLILAPDCEMCPGAGGLDETIEELKSVCRQQKVPYCFSLMRRELAYALHKRAQISCVAILDYDGANETYKQLLHELDAAMNQYKCLTAT